MDFRLRGDLKRLEPEYYRGDAAVHWSLTIEDRKTGWLTGMFLYRFRELLTHSMFRYGICCPIFCLMPDHMHMMWLGLLDESDQLLAMKHFRTRVNETLNRVEYVLQDQSFDHVLQDDARKPHAFREACDYVARNPERAELVPVDGYATYPYSGCIIPGYPELRPFENEYWTRFDRSVSYLRKNGLLRLGSNSRQAEISNCKDRKSGDIRYDRK